MKKINLLTQILIAFIAAILCGALFGPKIEVVKPLGELFLRLIQFIIVPLVLASLVVGVASTGDPKKLGRMGGKTIVYYLATTLIAITIGLAIALLLSPGSGVDIPHQTEAPEPRETEGFSEPHHLNHGL
ncbi:hypothetical protein GCM10010965_29030 [Caldalkalibacillus thermarum]|uniref:dicarboxylate/amino acid:cation symporter n=1 Tax=Caldalkalibacillus thermarum TaxID=296745 RepID=UPI001993C5CF|nr:cation:dicarboxylase symporter family transporter [Caldalkalibacillus thermarum]GGK34296.1 hypothetical protein GCM10010965_29030 [Caldalkalibacillus thermarum]